jgi:hypothetical protein
MFGSRVSRAVAWVALVAWCVGAGGPFFGLAHAFGDDVACGDPAWSKHPVTQVEVVHPRDGDGHCQACHVERTIRGAAPLTPSLFLTAVAALVISLPEHLIVRSVSLSGLPSRAPPRA